MVTCSDRSFHSRYLGCLEPWAFSLYLPPAGEGRSVHERVNVPSCGLYHPPPILPCSYSKLFPLMFCLLPVRLCLKQRPGTHSGLGGCLYHRAPRRAL